MMIVSQMYMYDSCEVSGQCVMEGCGRRIVVVKVGTRGSYGL